MSSRILVTGEHGWIGSEFARRLAAFPGEYELDRVSVRGNLWESGNWSNYDSVVHLAADRFGNGPEATNENLSRRVARKCSKDHVPHVVFMSSFHVYGTAAQKASVVVDKSTTPTPSTPYGRSKLASEQAMLEMLGHSHTSLAIVRSPFVYGPNEAVGNFPKLAGLAAKTPFFPRTRNQRSMIFSQSLCELVRLLCDNKLSGIYLPQDESYHDTSELVRQLGEAQGHRVRIVPGAPLCHAAALLSPKLGKLFLSDRYEMSASDCGLTYRVCSNEEAVRLSMLSPMA